MNTIKKALIPGSFDPITAGHADVIKKASELFDEVVVAVLSNAQKKNHMFSATERAELIKISSEYMGLKNITVTISEGLTTDTAEMYGCGWLVKGLRCSADFDYEYSLSVISDRFSPGLRTLFIPSPPELGHISSTYIRERIKYGRLDGEDFAPGTAELIKEFTKRR